MSNHDPFFNSPCFSNSLWEAPPEAINTSDWADTWPADTAASAPAVGDGLELPGGGAAALSEISPCEPLYGDLIDEQHSEQLQGEAMIIGAVSSAEQRREVCVSRILAEIQAGGGAAAALNESSTANAAASAADGANADSTTTMTAATRAFPLALASYGDAILRRSMNDLESLRCRHDDEDQVDPDDGGLRKIWGRNDTTGHSQSYHTGESFICPPATSSFQISGASFEALRAAHAAYPAEMDLTRAHHSDHRIFESETLLMGGETVRPDRQTATALRLGVDSSQSQRPWCGSVPRDPSQWDDPLEAYGDAQRDAADAANAVCMNALSAADAGVNFEATAEQLRESQGAGADVAAGDIARAGDGGTGMTLTGLLKQMKQRKRHAGASGHIDGARPASTTDMAQDPEALCKIVSLRDTASENSSSGSSSTAADEEGASSNSGLGDGDRSSSPLSGIAQALSDAALDEPESPAYAEAVTHAVTAPNPTPTETANMRTRVLFAAETAVTLVPAMPALSEGPTSQESIRRKAMLAALLQSSLARRRGEGGIAHEPGNGSPSAGFARRCMLESTQYSGQSTQAPSTILSIPRFVSGNAMPLRLPAIEPTRGASPPLVQSASAAEQPEEASKPRGPEASKVGEREIKEIREKGNKRAKLISRRMHAPQTGLRRVEAMEEYLQARSNAGCSGNAHPTPSGPGAMPGPTPTTRATPSGPEAPAPAAAGLDRAACHTTAAGSTNPSDPKYRWHNYGNKVIAPKGEAPFLRKYYRCSLHSAGGCRATRTIDVVDGQPEKITFQSTHNHSPPVRKAKRGRRQGV
ncbi:unnamed protein product [Closterium sp. NIES-54]